MTNEEAQEYYIETMPTRTCTCHADDRPQSCQNKYALTDCKLAAAEARVKALEEALRPFKVACDDAEKYLKEHPHYYNGDNLSIKEVMTVCFLTMGDLRRASEALKG